MATKPSSKKKKSVEVHLRLYDEDVRRLKELAEADAIPWTVFFRGFVHRALGRKGGFIA